MTSDEAIDVDTFAQRDGVVLLTSLSGAGPLTFAVPAESRTILLNTLLRAIRLHGGDEEIGNAAKICRSNLKPLRGSR